MRAHSPLFGAIPLKGGPHAAGPLLENGIRRAGIGFSSLHLAKKRTVTRGVGLARKGRVNGTEITKEEHCGCCLGIQGGSCKKATPLTFNFRGTKTFAIGRADGSKRGRCSAAFPLAPS